MPCAFAGKFDERTPQSLADALDNLVGLQVSGSAVDEAYKADYGKQGE